MKIQKRKLTADGKIKITEHELKSKCVKWFRMLYPDYLIFAVPNARKCSYKMASYLQKEGLQAGAPDVIIYLPNDVLNIEFKTEDGKQSKAQKQIEYKLRLLNHGYWVIRDFKDFRKKINNYIESMEVCNAI
jgi:hypothetical protein